MTSQIADYQLIRELGQGNYGVFYLARPPARLPIQEEFVAVKIFGSGTRVNPTTFRRAVTELKAFGAVRSPYLVRLFDARQERGVFYYAMEYLPRGSLADATEPRSRDDSIRAIEHAARAAHDLHEAGIVHRDIKPGNILMHEEGGRLTDLGLAQVLAPGLTVTSLGGLKSLEYLDPAVLQGARPSRASDIWALGASLHFALTGLGIYPKFPDKDVVLAMRTVASTTPVIDPTLSPDESGILRACLSREPSRRPATALEVAERLRKVSSAGL